MTALPLFKMLQTRVNHFFNTVELSAPSVLGVVKSMIDDIESSVNMRSEIAQTTVIDQDSHKYGDCRNSNGQSDLNGLIGHRIFRVIQGAVNP
jgi:hypothetical protein